MSRGRGSWPVLLAAAAAFLLAFFGLRARSQVLRIEADAAASEALAARHAVPCADVLALRALTAAAVEAPELDAVVASYARLRPEFGDPIAALAALGMESAARSARARGPDAAAAWAVFRGEVEALPAVNFLAFRERFALRRQSRG